MCDDIILFLLDETSFASYQDLILSGGSCQLALEIRFWREKKIALPTVEKIEKTKYTIHSVCQALVQLFFVC